ncbi:MAG: hypothetical protein J6B06_03790 [Lachnospiraceae bacterium]|nr:hypothetical protein [Lachnospiraceae bacterium]
MKGKNRVGRKLLKGLLTLLCSGTLLLSDVQGSVFTVAHATGGGGIYYTDPIILAGDTNTPTGKIGGNIKVRLHLVNRADSDAEDVTITPKVSSQSSEFPFEISKANYSMRLDGNNPGDDSILDAKDDDTVTFSFIVRDDVITGYYSIDYAITYVMDGNFYSTTVSSYVYIEGKDKDEDTQKSDIQISLQNSPALPPAGYGQPISFELLLTNYGKTDAYSVTITPQLSEDVGKFPFEIGLTSFERRLETALLGTVSDPSESSRNQRVLFNWQVRNDVKTGYYPVTFRITAKDRNGNDYAVDQTVYFNISGNPAKDKEEEQTTTRERNKSEPRLIITGYEVDKEEIKAGDDFQLTIHIMNTSDRTAVSNIKFTLSSSEDKNDNCFIPESGSSTMFVKRIGIGETYDLVVDMTAKPTLEAKSYPLTVAAEYEDSEVTAYTSAESISIPVTQELRISIGNVEVMPASIEVGSQSNIMFPINNMGKSTVYNVSVAFEGDSITGGECFKGNLESGATANVDTMVTGMAGTMDEGYIKAIISYENEKGEIFTQEKEIQLFVTEPYIPEINPEDMMWDDTMMQDVEEKPTLPIWMIFVAGGIVVAIGLVVAIVMIVKPRKRKKLEEEVDEDEIF